MPKTPKIDVITGVLKFHIPVDRNDRNSVTAAYALADGLLGAAPESWQATLETRLNRVAAPEPEPKASDPVVPEAPDAEPPDDLDIPDNLRRTTEPAAA